MKKIFPLCFFLLPCLMISAQQRYTQNLQLITGIKINKDLPKGFDISAQYQLRASNYLGELKGSYVYGTIQYTLVKKILAAEFEYRYVTSHLNDEHRFGIGVIAKWKHKDFTLSDRLVYQRSYAYFNSSYENGYEPRNFLRNRVQIKWDFKKHWDTYVSCEPFYRISNKQDEINRVRTVAGLEWEFKKHHTLNIFYQYQTDVNKKDPEMMHSIACIYEWDMPKFKKKKKE